MILITGATGNVGRPLIDLLQAEGAGVRAVTRNPRAGLPASIEVAEGDPSRPATLAPALKGVTTLFVNPAATGEGVGELLALAREHEVRRAVLLSALVVDDDTAEQTNAIAAHHKRIEDTLTESGLEWAILRPGLFATNTIAQWSGQIRAGDVVRGPSAGATAAPIHERDVAEVAARALLTGELAGTRPRLTGPRSLTQEEMVTAIGAAIGRPLRYAEIPAEAAVRGLVQHGFAERDAETMVRLQAASAGHPAVTTGEVARILGRPARTYAEWVADHLEAFQTA